MSVMRRALAAGALGSLGLVGLEIQRRRDLRAIEADPEWAELRHRRPGRAQQVVSADGTTLHAQVYGDDGAPTIVLVHGWTFSSRFWNYQIRDLSARFRVVAYDQRGHGSSQVPQHAASYSELALAADLEAVIGACVPGDERCVLAGHSMGGMTIVAWAGLHPDAVRRRIGAAILINTGMSEMVARLLVLGPRAGARVHRAVVGPLHHVQVPLPKRITPISLRLIRHIAASGSTSPGRVAFLHELINECPVPVRAGFGRLLSTLDLSQSVSGLDAPAVVIAGAEDRLLPPWHSYQLSERLPNARELVELPGIGHCAPVEAPDEVTSRIAELAEPLRSRSVDQPGRVSPPIGASTTPV